MNKTNLKTPLGDGLRHWFAISVLIVSSVLFSSSTVEAVKIEFDEQASSASASVAMSVYAGAESDTDIWQDSGIVYDHNMAVYTAAGRAWASGSASIHSDVNDAYSDEDGYIDDAKIFEFIYNQHFLAIPYITPDITPASFSVQLDASGNLYWNLIPSNPNEKEGDLVVIGFWDMYSNGSNSTNMIYHHGTSKEYWVGSQKLGPYHVDCFCPSCDCNGNDPHGPIGLVVRLGDKIKLSYNANDDGHSNDNTEYSDYVDSAYGQSLRLKIKAKVQPLKMTLIDKGWLSKNNLLDKLQDRIDLSPEMEQEFQAHAIVKGAHADGATRLILLFDLSDWSLLFEPDDIPADTETPTSVRLSILSLYGEDNGRLIGEGLDDCNDAYDDTPRIKNETFTQTWIAPPVFDSVLGSANHEKMRQIPIQIEIDKDGDGNFEYTFVQYIELVRPPGQFMITFDDGPVRGNTKNIVDALKNICVGCEPVKAGFFMVGCDSSCEDTGAGRFWPDCIIGGEGCGWLAPYEPGIFRTKGSVHDNQSIVREVAKANHIIGNHTQHHVWFWWWPFFSAVNAEITACNNELQSALAPLGKTPEKIFRPPYFVDNRAVRTAARKLGFQIIMGAGDERDKAVDIGFCRFRSLSEVEEKARDLIREWTSDEPCVLTFHDISPTTANNIAEIIRYLREDEGFTLVHFDPKRLPKEPDSVVHLATNTIHQSETVPHTVSLDSTVGTATFNVSWKGSDLDLVLYKPDGTKIDSNSALLDPNIKYAERDTYEYYTISDPNPGNWIMEVLGVEVPPDGETYTVRVEADTNLVLFAFTDKPDYALTEHINIWAQLANDENSVTDALVMAKVQRPDGSVDNLTLYDDGTHGDKDPNDGFYANAYNNTSLRGSYEITVSAIGDLTGDQYERSSSLTVMVGSIIYGNIDFSGYAVFADHWMAQNCTEPDWCDTADLDQSGEVDIFDLATLTEYWLEGTSP